MIDTSVLPHIPQRQDSLIDQLYDLRSVANRLGMYDAADYLRALMDTQTTKCPLLHAPYTPNDCSGFVLRDGQLVPDEGKPLVPSWMHVVVAAIMDGHPLTATKHVRNASDFLLADALNIVSHLQRHYKLVRPSDRAVRNMNAKQAELFNQFVILIDAEYKSLFASIATLRKT
jgi:hypothetical protein